MNIPILDGKYTISADKRQYILYRNKTTKDEETGEMKEYQENEGYFTSLNYLFKSLIDMEQKTNNCRTIEGYAKHIKKVNAEVVEIMKIIAEVAGGKKALKEAYVKLEKELEE